MRQVKSHTFMNKRRHLGAMSLGIKTTCVKSGLLCLLFRSFSKAASATAGGGAHRISWPFLQCVGIHTFLPSRSPPTIPCPSPNQASGESGLSLGRPDQARTHSSSGG
jgi:hypothetical protein